MKRSATAPSIARGERSEQLTSIAVPEPIDESIRDLCRTRSDAVDDLRRAKLRLKSFLLRQGYHYKGTADWSDRHLRYLRTLTLPLPAHKAVLEEYLGLPSNRRLGAQWLELYQLFWFSKSTGER